MEEVKILPIKLEYSGVNIIIGQAHFIKTVEDLYEALVSAGEIRFGISFNEASGDRLIRSDGNDEKAIEISKEIAKKIGAGHIFVIVLSKGYPINVMKKIKEVDEVVNIYVATANPLTVIVGEYEGNRGILGIIDGSSPLGFEDEIKKKERHDFLRKIGYKK